MDANRKTVHEGFEVDYTEWPTVFVTFTGSPDEAQFEKYIEALGLIYENEQKVALVLDGRAVEHIPASCIRRQARFLKEKGDLIRTWNVGTGIVVDSSVLRAVLRAVFAITPMPCEYRVFAEPTAAQVWCRARLQVA